MRKDSLLKLTASMLGCFAIVGLGSHCYNAQIYGAVEEKLPEVKVAANKLEETEEAPIIYTEVARFDTMYDFSDNKILAEHSDLIVIGKVSNLEDATNYNPTTKSYGKARTPGTLEILQVLKSDSDKKVTEVEFLEAGGLISYSEYEKSLLPAQKAKRDYLMQQNGITTRNNVFVEQKVENQLKIEEGKTYIMYLEYNSDFDKYMVVSQPYGVKEYNPNTGKILNHINNTVETIEKSM